MRQPLGDTKENGDEEYLACTQDYHFHEFPRQDFVDVECRHEPVAKTEK